MNYDTKEIKDTKAHRITNGITSLVIDPGCYMGLTGMNNDYMLSPYHILSFNEFETWINSINLTKTQINIDLPYFCDKEHLNLYINNHLDFNSERLDTTFLKMFYDALVTAVSEDYWAHKMILNDYFDNKYIKIGLSRLFEIFLRYNHMFRDYILKEFFDIISVKHTTLEEACAFIESLGEIIYPINQSDEYNDRILTFCTELYELQNKIKELKIFPGSIKKCQNKDLVPLIKYRLLEQYNCIPDYDISELLENFNMNEYINNEDLYTTDNFNAIIDEYRLKDFVITDCIIWVSLLTEIEIKDILSVIRFNRDYYSYSETEILKAIIENKLLCETYVIDDKKYKSTCLGMSIVDIARKYKKLYNESKNYKYNNSIFIFYNRYASKIETVLDNGYYLKVPENKSELDEILALLEKEDNFKGNAIFLMNPLGFPVYGITYAYSNRGLGLERMQGNPFYDKTLTYNEMNFFTEAIQKIEQDICYNS